MISPEDAEEVFNESIKRYLAERNLEPLPMAALVDSHDDIKAIAWQTVIEHIYEEGRTLGYLEGRNDCEEHW